MPAISSGAAGLRVIDGDDIEWDGVRYRLDRYDAPECRNLRSELDKALEWRRGEQAKLRLETLISAAQSLHVIDLIKPIFPGTRRLGTLLINGWEVSTIALSEGWGCPYAERKYTDWGDRKRPFPDLPVPAKVLAEEEGYREPQRGQRAYRRVGDRR